MFDLRPAAEAILIALRVEAIVALSIFFAIITIVTGILK